ncbi:DNA-binding transcriptional regulator GlcC [Escherichia coli]|nr:DNA-binding transcriptional regulator GlcC [Escherichia coli]
MKDERRPICEVVAESIERLIIDGVLKVGQPLPSERRLCEKLGFSRSALREGLTVLRGAALLKQRRVAILVSHGLIGCRTPAR